MADRHHVSPPEEMTGPGLRTVKSAEAGSDERLASKATASIYWGGLARLVELKVKVQS